MKAVIMAGGKGSRLQPLTRRMPKPMVPLLDRPVMEYILELLERHGIRDVAVTLGYMPATIREYFGDGSGFGLRLRYIEEINPLGTAGGVKNAGDFLDRTFLVISGDGLTDIDLRQAINAHQASGGLATLVLTRVACPRGYGVVVADDQGRIRRFVEKPQSWAEGQTYLINTGIYILEPEVLRFIPSDRPYDFGRELFPDLLRLGVPLHSYEAKGYWSDIGTLQQYYQTQLDMIQGRVNVALPLEVKAMISG